MTIKVAPITANIPSRTYFMKQLRHTKNLYTFLPPQNVLWSILVGYSAHVTFFITTEKARAYS
jgi:hypothetical protein